MTTRRTTAPAVPASPGLLAAPAFAQEAAEEQVTDHYPLFGSWAWGGLLAGDGWLEGMGFLDFAGSTVVHSVGGWPAPAGAVVPGPRIGKYGPDGKPRAIFGHSLPLASLGVFILRFGFNRGSTTAASGEIGYIAVRTNIAAAAGAVFAMLTAWAIFNKPDASMTLNGAPAGLVAITCPCDGVSPFGALARSDEMKRRATWLCVAAAVVASLAPPAAAGNRRADGWWAAVDGGNAAADGGGGWKKPLPVSFSVDYTIVSDYIWRGQNFSEGAGEGRDGLNHQLTSGVEWDLKRLGAIGYSVFLEWWAFEKDFNASDGHLQEVDHTLYWSYDLSSLNGSIPLSVELGWIAYVFPQTFSSSDGHFTHELYMILSLDDSKLFGTEGGVLNPYFSCNWDMDDFHGQWWEIGLSHDLPLSRLGMGAVPILKDVTVTPSFVMGIDHNLYSAATFGSGKATRVATLVYGLSVGLDVSGALGLPERWGALSATGFVNFSQPVAGALRENLMNDEFFGGLSLGWEW